jgi:hypothetical protein
MDTIVRARSWRNKRGLPMRAVGLLVVALVFCAHLAGAQTGALPPPAKSDKAPVEHGARPDPGEVRPGNRDGDAPSASIGTVEREAPRRFLGLPISAVMTIGGVIIGLLVIAGVVLPAMRRRRTPGEPDAGV